VIDGTDGRAHHVRFRGIEAFAHAPPAGGIVEVRGSAVPAIHGRPSFSPTGRTSASTGK
jgi:hypothetical protein